MLLNCGVGEDSWESLGQQVGQPVNPKGNHSWVFIGRNDVEAETPILGYLMWRTDSLEKTLILGKIEGRRRRGWQRVKWLDGIIDSMYMSLSNSWSWWWTGKWTGKQMDREIVHGVTRSWTGLSYWTELNLCPVLC